ncbi:putative pentatricopeptide repeat-containing protein [Vitis vinifera]|uniref:Putative pentatricopeptide repeat-containing protein n=1 Tax=Vitis vinifera TaxID=29760 RepID=A0A438F0Z3_VITVI|nr:putative pentatricopeptide repeat-containing protein [Vitis vinifera]
MNQRDLITWNTLIAGYERSNPTETSRNLLTGLPENIGRLSRLIHLDFIRTVSESSLYKVFPVRISSIPASIKGCCSLVEFYMGSFSHSLLQQNLDIWECLVRDWGTFSFRDIRSSLKPDMYSKCGNIADSHQVFGGMSRRDLVSWTTMMIGYETHGYGEEVVELFDKMVRTCWEVEEAYELIESMPFKPDECVWGHFLELVKHTADGKWGVCKTEKVDEKNGK